MGRGQGELERGDDYGRKLDEANLVEPCGRSRISETGKARCAPRCWRVRGHVALLQRALKIPCVDSARLSLWRLAGLFCRSRRADPDCGQVQHLGICRRSYESQAQRLSFPQTVLHSARQDDALASTAGSDCRRSKLGRSRPGEPRTDRRQNRGSRPWDRRQVPQNARRPKPPPPKCPPPKPPPPPPKPRAFPCPEDTKMSELIATQPAAITANVLTTLCLHKRDGCRGKVAPEHWVLKDEDRSFGCLLLRSHLGDALLSPQRQKAGKIDLKGLSSFNFS